MHAFLAGRWAPAALASVAFVVLMVGTADVDGTIWDEFWYVVEAQAYAVGEAPRFITLHPPLAKVAGGAAIAVLGDHPAAWRTVPALLGAGTVGLVFALARRLTARPVAALVPAVLLLTDGLFHLAARALLLDGMVAFWLVLAAWIWVASAPEPRAPDGLPGSPGPDAATARPARHRPEAWVVVAGVVAGAALATKWSAAPVLFLVPLLWRRTPARRPGVLVVALALTVATYLLTWLPWLTAYPTTSVAAEACGVTVSPRPDVPRDDVPADCDPGSPVAGLVRQHQRMLGDLAAQPFVHSQASQPWTWPAGWRPIVAMDTTCRRPHPAHCVPVDARQQRAIALPNPVTWWTFLAGTPLLLAAALRRDRVAAIALVGWAMVQLPLLLVDRTAFLTWMVPAVPFLALGAWRALDLTGWSRGLRAAPWAVGGGALAVLLPDRVPAQVALLAWIGWLVGAPVTARGGDPPTPRPGRRPLVAAVASTALFAMAAPFVRATPVAPTDARLPVADLLIGTDPDHDRQAVLDGLTPD